MGLAPQTACQDALDAAKDLKLLIGYLRVICRNGDKSKTSTVVSTMKRNFLGTAQIDREAAVLALADRSPLKAISSGSPPGQDPLDLLDSMEQQAAGAMSESDRFESPAEDLHAAGLPPEEQFPAVDLGIDEAELAPITYELTISKKPSGAGKKKNTVKKKAKKKKEVPQSI